MDLWMLYILGSMQFLKGKKQLAMFVQQIMLATRPYPRRNG